MNKILRLLAVTSAALLASGGALAGAITFDKLDPVLTPIFAPNLPGVANGDFLIEGDYVIGHDSLNDNSQLGDLVAVVADGSDPDLCVSLGCPTNNASNYLAMVNGGLPYIFRLDGNTFQLRSIDAAYIGASQSGIDQVILLVAGFVNGGLGATFQIELPPATDNNFQFATYKMPSAFTSMAFDEIDFVAFGCSSGGCLPGAFGAQFALDNISFVPEPGSLALVALGLVAAAGSRRRRQAAAA